MTTLCKAGAAPPTWAEKESDEGVALIVYDVAVVTVRVAALLVGGIDVVVELLVEMVEAPALRVDVAAETRLCVAMPVPLNGTVNTRPFERVKLSAAL
jgi:hypothetical protein